MSGDARVVPSAERVLGSSELNDKHWIAEYVIARQRYVYRLLQHDYDTVQRLSDPQVWGTYASLFEGDNALDKKLQDSTELLPQVLSITLNEPGIATVASGNRAAQCKWPEHAATLHCIVTLSVQASEPRQGIRADREPPRLLRHGLPSRRRTARCLMKMLVLAACAFALQATTSVALADERVRHLTYQEDSIAALLVSRYPTLIQLPSGELILDVASDGNQLRPRSWDFVWKAGQNFLIVEAWPGAQPASLVLKTAAHTYLFDLVPNTDLKLLDPRRTAKLVIELPESSSNRSATMQPQHLNDAYSLEVVHEVQDIRPRNVFDDGRFTYMRFPNNLVIPAIYRSVPSSKEERLVNSHMEGDLVILEGVAPLWTLRFGGSLLGVFNDHYQSEGLATPEGSTIAGKRRVLQ